MGADAEESLAHYDKHQDVEDELPLFRKPVRNVVRQVSDLPQFFDVSLRDGGDHPLASCSGHGWRRLRWGVRIWALELECAEMDKQRRKKA